jgi:hypothetical protein
MEFTTRFGLHSQTTRLFESTSRALEHCQEKHINSTRKKVQSVTQRKIHRKLAQFFKNSTKMCEIYIDHSLKNRHFETELNMSLGLYPWSLELCARVRTSVWANKERYTTSMA